jgi:hypothetical protein
MESRKGKGQIGVIGASTCSPEISAIATNVFFVICDGLVGVMPKPKVALWPVALIQGSRAVWPKTGKPIVGIKTWELGGRVPMATGASEAVTMVVEMLR